MKIKEISSAIKSIEPGSDLDDAQYIGLVIENDNNVPNTNLFSCKSEDGKEYFGRLIGKTSILNADGGNVSSPEVYLNFIKNGKKNLLHFNTISGIEITDSKGKIFNVCTSLGESYNYIKKISEKN